MLWTALHLCAEPMSEAAENPSPVSSGVLVTVKLYVYSNKGYSVFVRICMGPLLSAAAQPISRAEVRRRWTALATGCPKSISGQLFDAAGLGDDGSRSRSDVH